MQTWHDKSWANSLMRVNCCFLVIVLLFIDTLQAEEIVFQNDSVVGEQEVVIQNGFMNNDIGAAVFEFPPDVAAVRINKVQILWLSEPPDAMQTITHIHLYCGGLPDPGPPIGTASGLVMDPGFMHEADVSSRDWVVVNDGGQFAIGVEYVREVEQPVGPQSGHLASDNDGCQPSRNMVFNASTGLWLDPCAAGQSGDFVVRAIAERIESRAPFGDWDGDGDVDQDDFGILQACLSGDGFSATQGCLYFDCDGDGDVDALDLDQFEFCASGPALPADPECDPCLGLIATCTTSTLSLKSPDGGTVPKWTAIGILIWLVAVVLVGSFFLGPCASETCRSVRLNRFVQDADFLTSFERQRVIQALDWLDTLPDPRAQAASQWFRDWDYRNDCCLILINRWGDRNGFIAVNPPAMIQIIVHQDFVTGEHFSSQGLGLVLWSEWQHINDPGPYKERKQQQELLDFRQDNGREDVLPSMEHGLPEGE